MRQTQPPTIWNLTLSTSQQISFLWRKYQTFHPYVLLLLVLCFFDGVCIDFPRFSTTTLSQQHQQQSSQNKQNIKWEKVFLFFYFIFMIIFLCIENVQCVFIWTIQKMQHTHQHMCNYILCTSIYYVSCNVFFWNAFCVSRY